MVIGALEGDGKSSGKFYPERRRRIHSFLLRAGLGEVVAPVPGVEDGKAEGEQHAREHVNLLCLVDEKFKSMKKNL